MRFCVFFMGICCGELMLSTFYLFHRKFFLIFFSHADRFYYLPFRDLMVFWKRMEDGGRKSFRREELKEEFYLPKQSGFLVPYLEGIQQDLKMRD